MPKLQPYGARLWLFVTPRIETQVIIGGKHMVEANEKTIEVRTYPYERLMMEGEYITIFTDPSKDPDEVYLGHGEYANWRSESYTVKDFAIKVSVGLIVVTDVPYMICVEDIDKYVTWSKVESAIEHNRTHGVDVDKCPFCGSSELEGDAEGETDGCAQDWATVCHWSLWCNNCDDFSQRGQYITASGGSY